MRRILVPLRSMLLIGLLLAGCTTREPLPGPAITLYTEIPACDPGDFETSRARGVMEMYLSPDKPSYTIWNSHDGTADRWGVVTLVGVADDGTVTITLGDGDEDDTGDDQGSRDGDTTLSARPGRAFSGTGIHVIAAHPGLGTALLRSRWTRTRVVVPRPPVDEAEALDEIPAFSSVRPLPDGRVYLIADREPVVELSLTMHLSARREPWGATCYANPGDTIRVDVKEVLSHQPHWFVYLGQGEDGRAMFYEYSPWFRIADLVPDQRKLIAVPAYGTMPGDPPSE